MNTGTHTFTRTHTYVCMHTLSYTNRGRHHGNSPAWYTQLGAEVVRKVGLQHDFLRGFLVRLQWVKGRGGGGRGGEEGGEGGWEGAYIGVWGGEGM